VVLGAAGYTSELAKDPLLERVSAITHQSTSASAQCHLFFSSFGHFWSFLSEV